MTTPIPTPAPITTPTEADAQSSEGARGGSKGHCIDICNSLLRGEISAVETYDQAIEKFSDTPQAAALKIIRDEHARSVVTLRDHVLAMNGVPDESSGGWGAFANAVQAAANLFGENAALSSLRRGEEHGESEYHKAMEDQHLMPESRSLIKVELLPRVGENILALAAIKEIVE